MGLKVDKILGRIRELDTIVSDTPGANEDLKQYIQELISNVTIRWDQINGSPTTNTELKQYFDTVIELLTYNQYTANTQITAEMQQYFSSLETVLNNLSLQITEGDATNAEFKTYVETEILNLSTQITNITGAPILTQEIKTYIETQVSNLTINWDQITGSPIINQVFKTFIDNLIEDIENSFETFVLGQNVSLELKTYIDARLTEVTNTLTTVSEQVNLNQTLLTEIENQLIDVTTLVNYITENALITQEFKDYIENKFTSINNTLTEITNQSVINQAFKNTLETLLTEINQTFQDITAQTQLNQTLLTEIQNLITDVTEAIQYIEAVAIDVLITQEYKDYIDQKFLSFETKLTEITETSVFTTEIKNYIDDSIENITNVLEQLIKNTINQEFKDYITQITNITSDSTRLISGSVRWIEDLDFLVSPLVYQILNTRCESTEYLLTIPANVSNDPVFAIIYADIYGNIGHIFGTPAPSPSVPGVNNPSTQIAISTVYIAALGTEPTEDPGGETAEIVTEPIYDENIEWTTAKVEETGVAINLANETDPATATKHISITTSGGTGTYTKTGGTNSVQINQDGKLITLAAALEVGQQIDLLVSEIFPDHKTDSGLIDGFRYLKYYKPLSNTGITALLKSVETGTEYKFKVQSGLFTYEDFVNADVDFSINIVAQISLKFHTVEIPAGTYQLIVTGFVAYSQKFTYQPAPFIQPAAAAISFTRPTAINAKGGTIALMIKTGASWLDNTALIFDLYNAAAKVGSLVMIAGKLYGFNPVLTADYQGIILPIAAFNPTSDEITRLIIRPLNAWPNTSLYIDNISLQTGITPEIPTVEQVQADYTETNPLKKSFVRNKPALGTIAAKNFWTGTAAAYAAIDPKDSNTIYFVEEA